MMNPFTEVNWKPDTAAKRKFAVSFIIGFPCIAVLMLLVGRVMKGAWHPVPPMWIGGVGFAAGVLFWLLPIIAKPFYLVWYFIACCMGFVIGNLLLSLFFYVLFTPVGLLMRAMGRRSISKGFDKSAKTYWQDAKKIEDPASYYSQF